MNPNFVLDSGDLVVNKEDMKPAIDKLIVGKTDYKEIYQQVNIKS